MNTYTTQVSNVVQEFSRFAHQYEKYNMIQAKVASQLVKSLRERSYDTVIDVGCGSGSIFKNLQKEHTDVKSFIAMDSSEEMLKIHPVDESIKKVCADFNKKSFLSALDNHKVDLCISSSALQWSKDLNFTIKNLSEISKHLHAAIFTAGTFKTIQTTAGLISPIYELDSIRNIVLKYFTYTTFKVHHYKLEFQNTREMFMYIKQSGVSGGKRHLNYKQMKELMSNYPLNYLEFEVLFVEGKNE